MPTYTARIVGENVERQVIADDGDLAALKEAMRDAETLHGKDGHVISINRSSYAPSAVGYPLNSTYIANVGRKTGQTIDRVRLRTILLSHPSPQSGAQGDRTGQGMPKLRDLIKRLEEAEQG